MSGHLPYMAAGVALIGLSLYALVAHRHPLRRIMALNVMGSGAFLILIAAAARGDGPPDPVPHALVLTGIVVAVATSALAVAIARRLHRMAAEEAAPDGPERAGRAAGRDTGQAGREEGPAGPADRR